MASTYYYDEESFSSLEDLVLAYPRAYSSFIRVRRDGGGLFFLNRDEDRLLDSLTSKTRAPAAEALGASSRWATLQSTSRLHAQHTAVH